MLRRFFFELRYRFLRPRWDTGIVPPEVRRFVENDVARPGRAIDLGCGTGTSSVYLAQRGWDVTGIDFSPRAIALARRRAAAAGVAEHARFLIGDVTALPQFGAPFDLAVDVGCLHALSFQGRRRYAAAVARALRSGATVLLYAFLRRNGGLGLTEDEVRDLFADTFSVVSIERGVERGSARPSAWFVLRRS